MKIDELELKDWRIRYDLVVELDDDIGKFKDNCDAEHHDHLNLLCWALGEIQCMMEAEKHFLDLTTEISDAETTFLVQKHLHRFIEDTLYEEMKRVRDILYLTADECCDYDARRLARRYNNLLDALLETYEELYL